MIVRVNAPVYLLCISLAILGMYVANLPFRGDIYDIDSLSNYRLGFPLEADNKCNVLSEANMSLRLAYIRGHLHSHQRIAHRLQHYQQTVRIVACHHCLVHECDCFCRSNIAFHHHHNACQCLLSKL